MHKLASIALLICINVLLYIPSLPAQDYLLLRDKLQKANPGDFIVTASSKNYTLLHIHSKSSNSLIIEEVTIPESKVEIRQWSWRNWMQMNAPHNTSWVMYAIDLQTGQMKEFFSFTKNGWSDMTHGDSFLSTLLMLPFKVVPPYERKRIGRYVTTTVGDQRPFWQPPLVVDGQIITGVAFDAWEATWPKDGSDLAGKKIEIYLPSDHYSYISHFPYWLQVSGMIGKAKIRIIDSGRSLVSPKPGLPHR